MINTLNDIDVPCYTCGGFLDKHRTDCPDVRDESKMGGKYHGPSNSAGMTSREYWDAWAEEQDERNDW